MSSKVKLVNISYWSNNLSLPSNIPTVKSFIGYEGNLNDLLEAKQDGKTSFLLHGLGGVGKTELALHFIANIKSEFQAHIRVNMKSADENELLPKEAMLEIIRAFEPNVRADLNKQDIHDIYFSLLNQYKTVLFFDNAKDLLQIEPLISKEAIVVVTSRNSFHIPNGISKEIKQMSPKDAKNLLYSIASEERFEGKAGILAHLAGYLPITLSSLASLLAEDKTLKATDLVQKYVHRKEHLHITDPKGETPNVEAAFDLSYESLNSEIREYYRKLAVFPFDFDIEAITSLWQTKNVREICSELVKKYLLIKNNEDNRFYLHELAREYIRKKLKLFEFFEAKKLHANYYGELLSKFNIVTNENLNRFELERANIEQGFGWIKENIEKYDDDSVAYLGLLYTGYAVEILSLKLHQNNFIKWMQVGIQASRKIGYRQSEENQHLNISVAYNNLGDYRKAIQHSKQALQLAAETGDKQGEGVSLSNLGNAYLGLSEYLQAIEHYEQALQITEEIKDLQGKGNLLNNLGNGYLNLGNYQKAIEYYKEALQIAKEIGDRYGEGNRLGNLGNIFLSLGEYEEANTFYEQVIEISREIGDRKSEGSSLSNLGNIYLNLGNYQKAIEYYKEALQITKEIGDQNGEAVNLGNLGIAYKNLGNYTNAILYHEKALKISRETWNEQDESKQLSALGSSYYNLRDYQKAIEYSQMALQVAEKIGDRKSENLSLETLGHSYNNLGDYEKAIEYSRRVLHIAEEIGDKQSESSWLGNIGIAYQNLGEYKEAIKCYKQVLRIIKEIGNKQSEGLWLGKMGIAYFYLCEYAIAIEFYEQALQIAKEIGDKQSEGTWLGNMGIAYKEIGNKDGGMLLLKEALRIFENIKSPNVHIARTNLAEFKRDKFNTRNRDLTLQPSSFKYRSSNEN